MKNKYGHTSKLHWYEVNTSSRVTKRDLLELEIHLKHDLILRLGGVMISGSAIVAALVKIS